MIKIDGQTKRLVRNIISSCLCSIIALSLKAQDNSGCLKEFQLKKMQKSSLSKIQVFLNEGDWSFNGASTNKSFSYFGDLINYDVVSWRNNRYYSNSSLYLYIASGKPNIVSYQTSPTCFKEILSSFTDEKPKTFVSDDEILVTKFVKNGITYEFQESVNGNGILVYNSFALAKELKNQYKEEEARLNRERRRRSSTKQRERRRRSSKKQRERRRRGPTENRRRTRRGSKKNRGRKAKKV